MPLGHNRRDQEFGKVVPDARPPERPEGAAGLGFAILLSLGIHALVGLLAWHGFIARGNQEPGSREIVDTRVKNPGLEVEVYLKLLDPPKPGSKTGPPPPNSLSVAPSIPKVNDPSKSFPDPPTAPVAGAESSKPRSNQDSSMFAGASKTQPRPHEGSLPTPNRKEAHSPGGLGNGTRGDGTSFFQIGARAKSVVYVIDRSVSMGPSGGLVRAKQELMASLQGMPAETQFQIMIFNRSVEALSVGLMSGLFQATNENKRRAVEFLAPIQPEGGTLPVPALKRALALKPEVIFFLSDGGDWTDRQVQEVISVNRGHSVIHVVDFGPAFRDQLHGPLRTLASKNQGEYRAVSMNGKEPWQIRGN